MPPPLPAPLHGGTPLGRHEPQEQSRGQTRQQSRQGDIVPRRRQCQPAPRPAGTSRAAAAGRRVQLGQGGQCRRIGRCRNSVAVQSSSSSILQDGRPQWRICRRFRAERMPRQNGALRQGRLHVGQRGGLENCVGAKLHALIDIGIAGIVLTLLTIAVRCEARLTGGKAHQVLIERGDLRRRQVATGGQNGILLRHRQGGLFGKTNGVRVQGQAQHRSGRQVDIVVRLFLRRRRCCCCRSSSHAALRPSVVVRLHKGIGSGIVPHAIPLVLEELFEPFRCVIVFLVHAQQLPIGLVDR
jgi:hypothetical protein